MLVEIKKHEDKKNSTLVIDGEEIKDSYFSSSGTVEITDADTSQKFLKLSTKELIEIFEKLCFLEHIYLTPLKLESKINVNLKLDFINGEKLCNLQFLIQADYERWDNTFLIVEYMTAFHEEIDAEPILDDLGYYPIIETDGLPSFVLREKQLIFECSIELGDATIASIIEEFLDVFEKIDFKVHKILLQSDSLKSIRTSFSFPKELKIPCEQYLLYFAQFLQDLGINASSNLKDEAGKVLFSVTPTDDAEALDKIREALAVYLNLPSNPIVYDDSFAAMRLKQQIDSLKHSQQMVETEFRLKMAQSLVEAQSKTIGDQSEIIVQQATFIQQQKEHIERITNPAVMMNSAENKEELEEIYDGLKIGKSESLTKWLGVHLNPAKVIKTAVKNTFKNDEIISILNSESETDKK